MEGLDMNFILCYWSWCPK